MSATVVRTAVFELCPSCRRHGRIRTANGRVLPAVGSRAEAYKWLSFILQEQRAGDAEFITVEEARQLRRQIQRSGLPKQANWVSTEVQKAIQELNQGGNENGKCPLLARPTDLSMN